MRTFRSRILEPDRSTSFNSSASSIVDELSDSVVDFHLHELSKDTCVSNVKHHHHLLDISQDFCDFHSSFASSGSDISGELQRLAHVIPQNEVVAATDGEDGGGEGGWLDSENTNNHFISSLSSLEMEDTDVESIEPIVRSCVEILNGACTSSKKSAASRLRFLAKNRSDFRILIGTFPNAIPSLIPLLRSTEPALQENAVTALLNLSLEERNKASIAYAGAIKPLIYVLKTGTSTAKQNAACALLSLSIVEDNRLTIASSGAIPPLVSLLINGSSRGKKDAVTTLYKLCSVRQNKERAVRAGAVAPLVGMVVENGDGMMEKAIVVLNSLAEVSEGRKAIVEEGGIQVLVEALVDGSAKGREFAVVTLLQLCDDRVCGRSNAEHRALLVREGAIPPLVALSQSSSVRTKQKV